MHQLQKIDFQKLRETAQLIEEDSYGDKVLQLADGTFLKLFRRKRFLTSAALYPYAQRFADNAKALTERCIACPQIINVYRINFLKRDAVHYLPLPGKTIRQLFSTNNGSLNEEVGTFIAKLHNQGIYFRSLHFGNIIKTPSGELGLIDFADMRTLSKPLSQRLRLRNFNHLLRYDEDRNWLISKDNGKSFFEAYRSACPLNVNIESIRHRLTKD